MPKEKRNWLTLSTPGTSFFAKELQSSSVWLVPQECVWPEAEPAAEGGEEHHPLREQGEHHQVKPE